MGLVSGRKVGDISRQSFQRLQLNTPIDSIAPSYTPKARKRVQVGEPVYPQASTVHRRDFKGRVQVGDPVYPQSTQVSRQNRRKKTKEHGLTFLFIPPGGKEARPFSIPLWTVWGAAGTVVFTMLILVGLFLSTGYFLNRMDELDQLRTVNSQQEQKIDELLQFTSSVNAELQKVKAMDRQVRQMVGLQPQNTDEKTEEKSEAGQKNSSGVSVNTNGSNAEKNDRVSLNASRGASEARTAANIGFFTPMQAEASRSLDKLTFIKESLDTLDDELIGQQTGLKKLENDLAFQLDYLTAVPSSYPVRGEISSPFGNRKSPFGYATEFHTGIDIAANYGTNVRAASKGTITFSGWKPGLGRVVEVEHGHGFVTWYCHLSAAVASVGKTVERGDVIAKVGNSGRSTGPHLHFMVYREGKLENPANYLVH